MTFAELGLSPAILDAVTQQGYDTPSPIQAKAIPAVLDGRDVMAAAQTGTGKTAGFTLPVLERLTEGQRAKANQVRALVLTPTRELAAQVGDSVKTYSQNLPLRSTVVFGGVKINPQMMALRRGVDVLVATPGRLLDLYNQNAVKFSQLEVLVLDEADRMLDMGFIHDIRKILSLLPKNRQNLLFSATFSNEIRALAKDLVHDPIEISVNPPNATAKTVKQWIHPVDKKKKSALLTQLIKKHQWRQALVFTRTKRGANQLTRHLDAQGISASAIHGNKSQGARTRALEEFKNGKLQMLVATDIAARGLDIDQLPQVVNFDLPNVPADYVHRIGRTGRAGATGQAVSLVSADEHKQLNDIENLIGRLLDREFVDGFDPVHVLPESRLRTPKKPKKAKKPKPARVEHADGQRSGESARGHKPSGKNKRHIPAAKSGGEQPSRRRGKANPAKPKSPAGNKQKAASQPKIGSANTSQKPANPARKPRRRPYTPKPAS